MNEAEDQGETLSISIQTADGRVPVVISREAMEDHFGADKLPPGAGASPSLVQAYHRHEDAINAKAIAKMEPGVAYTRDSPLRLRTGDF